jgi:DEAD/DEAH box helicase domain-containing protein
MAKSVFADGKMSMADFIDWVGTMQGETAAHRVLPARAAKFADWPPVDLGIIRSLASRGIEKPYSHQALAIETAIARRDFTIVTPTASGKTLCYNVPVLDAVIKSPNARAIYLFPTKALSQDQLSELRELIDEMKLDVRTHTYDGDTPGDVRTKIRKSGHIVITNPDMLHTGILPHHTKWKDLFENLRYVVIDELHTYKGIYGSHLALIISRLLRICEFYGSHPSFICCSATIANPRELASKLTGRKMELISENGAPSGERHIIFYNPPVVNSQLGIRRSALFESARIAVAAVRNGIRTIVFSRSRINVELLLKYIQDAAARYRIPAERIAGYRGGYLPNERRAIERGLRGGDIHCVVSTNALELGIDIGSLELSVLHGYPGSVASAWQQIGRSGRRALSGKASAAVMVASSLPLDQFLAANPSYFFGASPEHARINPSNPYIEIGHVKCSSFELPFYSGEPFGKHDIDDALDYLARHDVLHMEGGRYHWQADSYPAASLSLRSATSENFVIHDVTDPASPKAIGQMDRKTAPTLIFPQAIYFHLGEPYQVEELDFERMRCYVKRVDVDYYTDGDAAARIEVLDEMETRGIYGWGEVLLASRPTIYKKIKLLTHENVGYGNIHLPEEQMHTTAFWVTGLPGAGQEEAKSADAAGMPDSLSGLANLVRTIAPLFLMCDRGDIIVKAHERDPHFRSPAIFVADNVPGGIGLSEALFDLGPKLFEACLSALSNCKCAWGCPACIGATVSDGGEKAAVMRRLRDILKGAA